MRRFFVSVFEVVEVVVVALVAVYLIRNFLVQPFLVSGASMVPTFAHGDYILIDELSFRFRHPERGEVIVFRYPNDESTYFIKRVIGMPFDRLILKDGKIIIVNAENPHGKTLDETYLPAGVVTTPHGNGKFDFTLGANQYFVMGDNRPYSFDSRDWGVVAASEVIGAVRLRLWPVTGFSVFAAPGYPS